MKKNKSLDNLIDGEKKVDNVVFMGTPQMKKHSLDFNDMGNNANAIKLYDTGDGVQKAGSRRIFGGNHTLCWSINRYGFIFI